MTCTASIIICTRNRAAALEATLQSLAGVHFPPGDGVELLVIDNGSTDETPTVVRQFASKMPDVAVQCIIEPKIGLSNARNRGIASSKGSVILFTDDDVRFPEKWISKMCEPILSGQADVVAGGVTLAPHLLRPWMLPLHRTLLASSENLSKDRPDHFIGANMALSRKVLEKVPLFDSELGAGKLGFGEETLFAFQLRKAGFQIAAALENAVEHHFDATRLERAAWLSIAEKMGHSGAYIDRHWRHVRRKFPLVRAVYQAIKLWIYRTFHPHAPAEGISRYELLVATQRSTEWQYFLENRRRAKYELYGLMKLDQQS